MVDLQELRKPCRKCFGNGFLTNLGQDGTGIFVCDECKGMKYMIPAPAVRDVLGVCIHCSEEIHISSGQPCPKGDRHTIPAPDFLEEKNG